MRNPWIPAMLLLAAMPVAAQVEVGDLSGFKEALKSVEVPAAPASAVAATAALPPVKCPVLSLNGATVGRGLFESDYTVKINGEEVGKVAAGNDGMTYTAGGAGQATVSVAYGSDGARRATVKGCDGETLGVIVETESSDSSRFVIVSGPGKVLAASGDVSGTTWSLSGPGGSAEIKNAHPIVDRYALTMSGLDGRLVLAAAVMNNQALYRRAAQRRRDNPHEPHGGRGDR